MTSCKRFVLLACMLWAGASFADVESNVEADEVDANVRAGLTQSSFPESAALSKNKDADPRIQSTDKSNDNKTDTSADSRGSSIARYLWDESETVPNVDLASFLWDESETVPNVDLAAFLWDERDRAPQTATYLWGNEDSPEPEDNPGTEVAKFLWDGDDVNPAGTLASYLWQDDRLRPTNDAFLIGTPQQANPQDLGHYLWSEGDTYQQIASLGMPLLEKVTREFIVVASDFSRLESDLVELDASIVDRFEIIRGFGVELDRDQHASLSANKNVISLMENHQVETAGVIYSAKGDAELGVKNRKVSWTIHNLGNRPLNFETLELSWPAENGKLKKVKIDGNVVYRGSAENTAIVEIDTKHRIRKNKASTITLVFSQKAEAGTDNYDLVSHFKEGLTLEYAFENALPVQGRQRDTFFPTLIDADMLHVQGITGKGVGVAIIDTGSWSRKNIAQNTDRQPRVAAYYDAIENRTDLPMSDQNGHGTHIASVVASSKSTLDVNGNRPGSYHGIAPDANLVIVKAFDENGRGSYMNVIRAIIYVIAHKQEHNIRVLNLSFGATPMSHYWQDPLNLAVMAAWRAGIVVVVSSGNNGPDPMTVGVPGNVPYVLTVGAMTDSYTPEYPGDDRMAIFSSAGPTLEGHVKPEVTAPGGHMMGQMSKRSTIANEHPEFHDGYSYFLMSGTSQASAVASGVAALMIQNDPELSADDVKCRLMSSARAATQADGTLAYSVFQQGTGLINAFDAVYSTASGCVNKGLDINKDLAGVEHYGGPANQAEDGSFYLSSTDGFIWNLSEFSNQGYFWNMSDVSNAGFIWNLGIIWNLNSLEQNGFIWNLSDFESNGYSWNLAELEQNGYIWNLSELQNEGFIWNLAGGNNNGFIWNLADVTNEGFIWNLNSSETDGYIWNLGNIEGASMVWNMAFTENDGYIWNLGYTWDVDAENQGFIWNLGSADNQGYIWNLSDPTSLGYIWNLSDPTSAGFIWNLANAESEGFIWNLNDSENNGFIWNLADASSDGIIWNLADADSDGFIWNLADAGSDGFIWNLSDAENNGFIWNLADATNQGFIWNLSEAQNNGFIWNLASAENEGFIWNLSNMSVNKWVSQE
ncbi:MAG: serine protease AprX [Candidatus Azotimanducaceae bacterium]|jgi:serine protease AprX